MANYKKQLEKIVEENKKEESEIPPIHIPTLERECLKYGKGAENIFKAATEYLQTLKPKTEHDEFIIILIRSLVLHFVQDDYISLLSDIKTQTTDKEGRIKKAALDVYMMSNAFNIVKIKKTSGSLNEILPLPKDAKDELQAIYKKLDAYFFKITNDIGALKEPKIIDLIIEFIEKECNSKEQAKEIIKAKNKPIGEYLKYPIDPINNIIWHTFFDGDKIPVGQKAYIDYDINFDELEKDKNLKITKRSEPFHLEPFDKILYNIASNLYEAGNEYTTVTQIYKAMGKFGNLTTTQREEINNALTKMRGANIHIDNPNEIQFYKRRARARYDGALLPFERVTVEINGKTVENAIHFLREPPLFSLAKKRGQIINIKKEVYDIPLKHTEINDELSEYLLPVINAMKQLDIKPYLTFATIFEKCGITDKVKKVRAKERIKTILEHFKNTKYINEYEITKLGIKFPEFEIPFNEQQKRKQKAKLERKAKQIKK